MNLFSWADSRIQTLRWYDISLVKLAAFTFALLVAKVWPAILSFDWPVYLAITIVASLPVLIRMFR